jgi:hypothetical protein
MSIDMTAVKQIRKELAEEGRGTTSFHPVSLPQVLRERFQGAADEEMGGDFSNLLETVLRTYLIAPRDFPVCWVRASEGSAKNKPVSLSDEVIKGVKEEAKMLTDGVFARLVQIIIRGYLVDRGYLKLQR